MTRIGHAWLTCEGCENETTEVSGERDEAEAQAEREGWEHTEQGWLCKYCMRMYIPLEELIQQAEEAQAKERARLIARGGALDRMIAAAPRCNAPGGTA